jgi:ABC-type microcin C transport system permease subunit YejB
LHRENASPPRLHRLPMASRSSSLLSYTLTRLMMAPLMVWFAVTLVFMLVRVLPGSSIDGLGPKAPPAVKAAFLAAKGYDKPIIQQYWIYLDRILHFNLGTTEQGESVTKVIGQYFPATVELTVFSLLVAVTVGVLVGAFGAFDPTILVWDSFAVDFLRRAELVPTRHAFSDHHDRARRPNWLVYDRQSTKRRL